GCRKVPTVAERGLPARPSLQGSALLRASPRKQNSRRNWRRPWQRQNKNLAAVPIPSASATAAAAAAAAKTTARRSFLPRPRLVHRQHAAIKVLLMKHLDGFVRLHLGCHLDEAKPAGTAGRAI